MFLDPESPQSGKRGPDQEAGAVRGGAEDPLVREPVLRLLLRLLAGHGRGTHQGSHATARGRQALTTHLAGTVDGTLGSCL